MNKKALIVVDVQNGFRTGGNLATPLPGQGLPAAENILPFINDHMANGGYAKVVLTQDFHPENHCSFARTLGVPLFTLTKTTKGRTQMAWTVHCVAGTEDANFHPGLYTRYADLIIRKGTNPDFDSYSGFKDDGGALTGLLGYLLANGIEEVDIVGIATDYCVKATAIDAKEGGLKVNVLLKGCGGVAANTIAEAIAEMRNLNINVID